MNADKIWIFRYLLIHVLIKSSLLDSVLVVVNTIMFDGVILGDACLIVMSSTRRLQAITGNAGFFRGGYHNVIVVFSPYRGSTVAAAASSATLTVVSCADAIPNGDSANILAIDTAIIFVFDIHTVLLWTLPDNCLS